MAAQAKTVLTTKSEVVGEYRRGDYRSVVRHDIHIESGAEYDYHRVFFYQFGREIMSTRYLVKDRATAIAKRWVKPLTRIQRDRFLEHEVLRTSERFGNTMSTAAQMQHQ